MATASRVRERALLERRRAASRRTLALSARVISRDLLCPVLDRVDHADEVDLDLPVHFGHAAGASKAKMPPSDATSQ
jgi:hypothetical protein